MASESIADIVALIKRTAQLGDVANLTDRINTDIIKYYNIAQFKIWRAWDWDWSFREISFATSTAANTIDSTKTVDGVNIGKIKVLYISSVEDYLVPMTLKEYLRWHRDSDDETSTPIRYVKVGSDSSNDHKILLVPTPSAEVTVKGWGKVRINKATLASISAGSNVDTFFPEEVQDLLFAFTYAQVLHLKGKPADGVALWQATEQEMEKVIESEQADPDEEMEIPPPDFIRWKNRKRKNLSVV